VWAAEGKQQVAWELQSSLMALTANLNRKKGQKPYKPADFNPITKAKKRGKRMTRATFDAICAAIAGVKPSC
jgi:hypothetical protein